MKHPVVDSSGRLDLPYYAVKEIGEQPLALVSHSSGHLFFSVPNSGVSLAGQLGEVTLIDLLSFINMYRKTGMLCLDLRGGRKQICFHQGEIVYAASTFAEEHICEILFEQGKLDRDALLKARQLGLGQTQTGKLLVEKEMITAQDLWLAARFQVEVIVYNLFSLEEGSFYFREQKVREEDQVRLQMSTQNLIMEGLRRIDERAMFMGQVRSLEAIPMPTGQNQGKLDEDEQRLLAIIGSGRLNVRSVLRRSGMGELDGLRMLHQLILKRAIYMEDAPTIHIGGDVGEILDIFNSVLEALFKRIVERKPCFLEEVRTFMRAVPSPISYVFRDVVVHENGTLDGGRLLANLAGLGERDKKKLLAEALSELLYMECHVLRRELGSAESAELVQRVQEIPRRIKNILERKE